jgi:hypothetical protein
MDNNSKIILDVIEKFNSGFYSDKFSENYVAETIEIMIHNLVNNISTLYVNEEELILRNILLKFCSVLRSKIS